jgi:hypothetical protein
MFCLHKKAALVRGFFGKQKGHALARPSFVYLPGEPTQTNAVGGYPCLRWNAEYRSVITGDTDNNKGAGYCQYDNLNKLRIMQTASAAFTICDVQQYGQGILVTKSSE